ncbi:MAG: hypothetical protein GF418_11790 [Chitinivibrionales bacterium]|nr:hypothetical protein [Chitinivibrionales bacterium]MBD3396298.1 hypothetical protein [Chitinivibrionales bacterium]
MNRTHPRHSCIVCAGLLLVALSTGVRSLSPDIEVRPAGRLQYEMMQLVHTTVRSDPDDPKADSLLPLAWRHDMRGEFAVDVTIRENAAVYVGIWSTIGNNFVDGRSGQTTIKGTGRKLSSGLTETKLTLGFGSGEERPFTLTAGLFKFAYNDDARDLGEYLFKSQCYPGVLYSGFDSAQIVGAQLRSTHADFMTHDLFVTSELEVDPMFDFSLAYLGEFRVREVFTFGLGGMLYRLIPVNPDNTKPSIYRVITDTVGTDAEGDPIYEYDTLTFAGVKAMGRFMLDPKPLLGSPDIFGPEDLKLYAEGAVLGVQDQGVFYEDIMERIPIMVGFNVPAFKLLDVLAAELEYYGSPHVNNPDTKGAPYQHDPAESPDHQGYGHENDIKWAITAIRGVGSHVSIRARVASDHLRTPEHTSSFLVAPDQFYWSLKFSLTF